MSNVFNTYKRRAIMIVLRLVTAQPVFQMLHMMFNEKIGNKFQSNSKAKANFKLQYLNLDLHSL